MTLIIEDGQGVAGADSFITVAEAEAFEIAYWGADTGIGEPELRRAFVLMSVLPWKPDLWPTFDGDIPQAVKNAQAAIARVEKQSPGSLSPVFDRSQAKTLIAVGALAWSPKSAPNTEEAARPIVTFAMDLLRAAGLLQDDTGGVSWLLRA